MRKTWAGLLATVLVLLLVSVRAEAQLKVGVVDLQKALEASDEGRKAKAELQKQVEKIQQDLKTRQDELNALKEEIERQGSLLSETARYDKEKRYQDKLKDFKRLYEDYQEEMRRQDQSLSEKVFKQLAEIIEALGAKEGFDIILEKTQSAVLYRSSKVDITDQVIKMADERKKAR